MRAARAAEPPPEGVYAPWVGERLATIRRQGALVRDLRKLTRPEPPIGATYEEWRELRLALDPAYERYVADVSTRRYAASLELSAVVWHLCRVLRPAAVLELGSGFTSYVLRRYAAESAEYVDVVSLDHDPVWLEKTAGFLEAERLPSTGLASYERLSELARSRRFDLIVNDLHGPLRDEATTRTVPLLADGGAFVLDDADRAHHRRSLFRAGARRGLSFYDLRPWTNDLYWRWAIMAK